MNKTLEEFSQESEELKKEFVKDAKEIKPFIESLRDKPITFLVIAKRPEGVKIQNLGDKILIDYKHLGIHVDLTSHSFMTFMIPDTQYMCYGPDEEGTLSHFYCMIDAVNNFRLDYFSRNRA